MTIENQNNSQTMNHTNCQLVTDNLFPLNEKDINIESKGKITLKSGKGVDVDGGSKMTIKAGAPYPIA